MKKILPIVAVLSIIAILITACNNRNTAAVPANVDTTGFAQFQVWKAMNDQQASTAYTAPVAKRRTGSAVKTNTMSSSTTNTAMKKKGWSKGAKYAAIGGGSGAILGAVINKRNRVAGGVIGAIIGGGAGYVFGHSKDKKDGRL